VDISIDGGKEGFADLQDLSVQLGVGTGGEEQGVLEVVDVGLSYAEI
jgi:hypothetical protein